MIKLHESYEAKLELELATVVRWATNYTMKLSSNKNTWKSYLYL